jgi:hypothetical protein
VGNLLITDILESSTMDWACQSIPQTDMISHPNKYSVTPTLLITQHIAGMGNLQHQVKERGLKCVGKCQKVKVVIPWWSWCIIKMSMHLTWNLICPWWGEGVEWTTVLFSLKLRQVLALSCGTELLSLLMSAHNYYQAFNVVVLNWCHEAVNAWMAITLNTSIKIYKYKSCGQSVCTCVTHLRAPKEDYH